jgi:hypothetical protein
MEWFFLMESGRRKFYFNFFCLLKNLQIMQKIVLNSYTICCSKPFKFILKLYSHIHLITSIVWLFFKIWIIPDNQNMWSNPDYYS